MANHTKYASGWDKKLYLFPVIFSLKQYTDNYGWFHGVIMLMGHTFNACKYKPVV